VEVRPASVVIVDALADSSRASSTTSPTSPLETPATGSRSSRGVREATKRGDETLTVDHVEGVRDDGSRVIVEAEQRWEFDIDDDGHARPRTDAPVPAWMEGLLRKIGIRGIRISRTEER
jgi:hypothetical protein